MPVPQGLFENFDCFDFRRAEASEGRAGEHDFGAFDVDGHTIMFKIDYLDQTMSMHSPEPADPAVTQRVITIMLAEEY